MTLMLNISDRSIQDLLSRCKTNEDSRKKLKSKLQFFDMSELTATFERGQYHADGLKEFSLIDENELVDKIIPMESNWLGVALINKETKNLIHGKVLLISPTGQGYITQNTDCFKTGEIPLEIYKLYFEDVPFGHIYIDKKYFDGKHDGFLAQLYDHLKTVLAKEFAKLFNVSNLEFEDIKSVLIKRFKYASTDEEKNEIKYIDFLYSQYCIELIYDFYSKHNIVDKDKQPN